MVTLQAKNLTLEDVQTFFGFQEQFDGSFGDLLSLQPLTEFEQRELTQIRDDFRHYVTSGKVSEGQVKFLVIAPLMKLAGFYKSPLAISLEEDIAEIEITDLDTTIKGRMDILAVKKALSKAEAAFWVLVIEAKNSEIAALTGLPQLLTYAYKSLENQPTVWGLTTNGVTYQFVYLSQGNPPIYQLLPDLSLINSERSLQLLQVLKAICALIAA
ncbi:restriction endonuclease subunit R [Tumidithrix elongata RA019]|uniref:Restriction endonuclease subunit R n=1 Tax=Tumidithrix elongata BACA0141 TaxID=2716417 RepID=A0AAW9Q5Z2_9CYAN|nr:restriction endonuclease subunit R [Tumidithrix elongata RA019]